MCFTLFLANTVPVSKETQDLLRRDRTNLRHISQETEGNNRGNLLLNILTVVFCSIKKM